MMDERLDLSALEPDATQRELLVAAIMARAGSELARRSADVSPMAVLSDWIRPALAAAALVAAISLSVLSRDEPRYVEPGAGLTDALAVPAPVNEWLISGRDPTAADLLVALEGENR